MESFRKRNPNFYVFNAVLHNDEATPHLHLDYIPIGHYKRGVDTQTLRKMSYGEGENAISRWRAAEVKVLTEICAQHGIEISAPQKSRGYSFKTDKYKHYKDTINAREQHKSELYDECYKLTCERKFTTKLVNKTKEEAEKVRKELAEAKTEAEGVKCEAPRAQEETALIMSVAKLNSNMVRQMARLNADTK